MDDLGRFPESNQPPHATQADSATSRLEKPLRCHRTGLSRATIAEQLGSNQENASRLEQHSDPLLSTLYGCVEAMGGQPSLVAQFPDRPPVALTGMAVLDEQCPAAKTPDSA